MRERAIARLALRHFACGAIHQKQTPICDRRPAVAAIDRRAPQHLGSAFRQSFNNTRLAPNTIPPRSEPLRPVVSAETARRRNSRDYNQDSGTPPEHLKTTASSLKSCFHNSPDRNDLVAALPRLKCPWRISDGAHTSRSARRSSSYGVRTGNRQFAQTGRSARAPITLFDRLLE